MKRLIGAAALILVAGCQKAETQYADGGGEALRVSQAPAPAAADVQKLKSAPGSAPAPITVSAPMLAYSYQYGLETPSDHLAGLMKSHEQACQSAGPTVCQIVGQQLTSAGKDRLAGQLSLRATPTWIHRFRGRLDEQTKAAGGRVVASNTSSEDLTRAIVDTEAALRARSTLRDRLQALLASHPGKLADLLQVEQELARVQGEIDATQSELAVMRTRVATSALSIEYRSAGVLAPQGVWSPLGHAVDDVVSTLVVMLALLIRLATVALPLGVLAFAGYWLWRRRTAKLA